MNNEAFDSGLAFARLRELSRNAGETLHERLLLAKRLLADREWVLAPEHGGGDEGAAIDRLEELCFGDAPLSLPEMFEVLEAVPELSVWRQKKFQLRRMLAEMRERQRARAQATAFDRQRSFGEDGYHEPLRRKTFVPQTVNLETENVIEKLREELREKEEQIKLLKQENVHLRKAVKSLQKAVAEMNVSV